MEAFYSTIFSVPMTQLSLLLLLSTLSLLFGRIKLALLVNYCFTLYWGYILNMDVIRDAGQGAMDMFTYMYFGFGLVILMLALVGFLVQRD